MVFEMTNDRSNECLALAHTWGMPPPGSFIALRYIFDARDLIFWYNCICNLLKGSPKISSVCNLSFLRYDLVLEVMSRPK